LIIGSSEVHWTDADPRQIDVLLISERLGYLTEESGDGL